MKRFEALLREEAPKTRRAALLNKATARTSTRRQALLRLVKLQPTRFKNRAGRDFYLTQKGTYVVLKYGKRVYGCKARFMNGRRITNASHVPTRIRPKRV